MRQKACLILLSMGIFQLCLPAVWADNVKEMLNQRYKNQIVALRSPFVKGEQEFDSAGKALKNPNQSSWLVYGGIYVRKISLSRDALLFEGPRIAFTGKEVNGVPAIVPLEKSVRIRIHLDQPLTSRNDSEALLNRIFYQDKDNSHARPDYRRPDYSLPDAGGADGQVFRVGKDGTKAPVPTYTPEPEYSREARDRKYQSSLQLSIVVDTNGKVCRIRVERAAGLGLDEQAIDVVKTWRFQPATRNGQPVAVEMNVDVRFRLY